MGNKAIPIKITVDKLEETTISIGKSHGNGITALGKYHADGMTALGKYHADGMTSVGKGLWAVGIGLGVGLGALALSMRSLRTGILSAAAKMSSGLRKQ